MLRETATQRAVMEGFEIEQDFSGIGRRTMLLNARTVFCDGKSKRSILLAIEDITERRAKERELKELLQHAWMS